MIREFDEQHCWQYDIRLKTLESDLDELNMTQKDISKLRVSDFKFALSDKSDFKEIKDFIIKYEWLGSISSYPTHYFTARYKGILAGVLIFNMPNAFSKLLGEKTPQLERLLSRGACASWTPKNLASSFIMWAISYMVNSTQYRLFTAYSDPTAKELGTIYQACNWIYIGQSSGTQYRYREPNTAKWISDRKFRNVSSYKKYAKEMGTEWENTWSTNRSVNWNNVPNHIEKALKQESKNRQASCEKIATPPKHKYIFIKGRNQRETKELLDKFRQLNPKLVNLPYPKKRG